MKKRYVFIIITLIIILLIIGSLFFFKSKPVSDLSQPPIRIVLNTDSNYVIPTRTLIRSIRANKDKNTCVEINILGNNLYLGDIQQLESEARPDLKINIINDKNNYLSGFEDVNGLMIVVSRTDNFKFFIPELFPDYDKILYLDSDTVVLKDLSELYNTDLGDNYAAVVDDWQSGWEGNVKKRYFNNGVMLLNLAKMRKDNVVPKLLEAKKNDKVKRFVTQDAFNQVMQDKVLYLPLIYDTFAPEYERDIVLDRVNEVLGDNYDKNIYPYKSAKEFRKNVVIIHYCGWFNAKPWQLPDFKRSANNIWYRYAPFEFWQEKFL